MELAAESLTDPPRSYAAAGKPGSWAQAGVLERL